MKSLLLRGTFVTALVLLALAGTARAQDNDGCSLSTLHGDYAFRISGYVLNGNLITQFRDGIAMTHFNGDGTLTQTDYVLADGAPMGPQEAFRTGERGTYLVNADCTGTAEIDFPPFPGGAKIDLIFVLSNQGRTIHTVVTQLFPPGFLVAIPASIHSDGEKVAGVS